jgi:MFS family permease
MKRSPVTLLCAVQFIVVLDVTIVAVALPAIRADLGFAAAALQWVITAYTLTFGGLLVVAGRVGDLGGRRRVLRLGLALFGVASLGCALAWSAGALVALRALQGVGAALLAPAALALLTATYPEGAERRRAVAWWTAAAAGGGASGWVLGGVLVDTLGWPAVFLANVPICAVAIALAPRVLAGSRAARRRAGGRARLDVPGSITVTVGLAALVNGLTRAEAAGFGDPVAAVSLAGAALALSAFAVIERRAQDPILPPAALARPGFAAATGGAVAVTATTTPAMFLAILFQQDELGRGAAEVGLWCAPLNLAVIAGSLLRPPGSARLVMTGGLAVIAAGALLLTVGEAWPLLPAMVLMGLGLGAASVASTASGTAALPAAEQGIASGVLNAAAQVGTVVGLAILVPLGSPAGFAGAAAIALAVACSLRADRAADALGTLGGRRRRAGDHRPLDHELRLSPACGRSDGDAAGGAGDGP